MRGYAALLEKVYKDDTKPQENLAQIKKFLRAAKMKINPWQRKESTVMDSLPLLLTP
jgi:hypothetical protein